MSLSQYMQNNVPRLFAEQGSFLRLGQIDKVHFIDDETNISKTNAEYDVILFDDQAGQTVLRNVRALKQLGSSNDASELIFENNEIAFEKELDESNPPQNKNGTYVVVLFLDNSYYKPFIIGAVDHPKTISKATRENGVFRLSEFRGLRQEINKNGELELIFQGPKLPDGKPQDPNQKPITLKIGKTGEVSVQGGHRLIFQAGENGHRFQMITASNQIIQVEDTEGNESVSIVHKTGSVVSMDKEGSIKLIAFDGGYLFLNAVKNEISLVQKAGNVIALTPNEITITHKGGKDIISVTEDKIQLTTGGSIAFQASGYGVKAGTIDIKDQSPAMAGLKVSNGLVALGSTSAELLDLFDQLLSQLNTLVTNIASSTHTGNLGFPTSPPLEAAAYTPIQTQINLIKTKLATIKGSL